MAPWKEMFILWIIGIWRHNPLFAPSRSNELLDNKGVPYKKKYVLEKTI